MEIGMSNNDYNRPVPNRTYTVREIGELYLDDAPFLRVKVPEEYGGGIAPIQNEVYSEEILEVIGDLEFKYQRTTIEWIPLFIYVGDPDRLKEVLDFELHLDPYADEVGTWVTVKGHPEEQYYSWHDESRLSYGPGKTDYIEAPMALIEARDRLNKLA